MVNNYGFAPDADAVFFFLFHSFKCLTLRQLAYVPKWPYINLQVYFKNFPLFSSPIL